MIRTIIASTPNNNNLLMFVIEKILLVRYELNLLT